MDKILSIQTIKNVFAALGAKTSDSNYGVALLDKTTAEPKGLMDMPNLASVLGVEGFFTTKYIPIFSRQRNVNMDYDNHMYGIYYLWEHNNNGGCVLIFTAYYASGSNGLKVIFDAGNFINCITKPNEGSSIHIETLNNLEYSLYKLCMP